MSGDLRFPAPYATRPKLHDASLLLRPVCPQLQASWPDYALHIMFPALHFPLVSAMRSAIREKPLRLLAVFRPLQDPHRVCAWYTMFADHHLLAVDAKAPALRDKRFPHPPICVDLQAIHPNYPVHTGSGGRRFPPSCAKRPELREARFPPLTTYSQLRTANLNFGAYKAWPGCLRREPYVVWRVLCSRVDRRWSGCLAVACDRRQRRENWPNLGAPAKEAFAASRGLPAPTLPPPAVCHCHRGPRQDR